jgi:hypothetical protein
MVTGGYDRALALMPSVPLRALPAWEQRVEEVGGIEAIQRGMKAKNPHPLDYFSYFEKRVRQELIDSDVIFNTRPLDFLYLMKKLGVSLHIDQISNCRKSESTVNRFC